MIFADADFTVDKKKILGQLTSNSNHSIPRIEFTIRDSIAVNNYGRVFSAQVQHGSDTLSTFSTTSTTHVSAVWWSANSESNESLTFKSFYHLMQEEKELVAEKIRNICKKLSSLLNSIIRQESINLVLISAIFSSKFGGNRNLPVA